VAIDADQIIISGDSHFVEPPDLFATRLPTRLRARAPQTFKGTLPDGRSGEFFVCEDVRPAYIGGVAGAGRTREEANRLGYDGAPKSVWDPAERLKEQDLDGISAEVLYPSWGMFLFSVDDDDLRRECFNVFNEWAGEYCRHAPHRMKGLGVCDLGDIGLAVQQLDRIAELGLCGAAITSAPEDLAPYSLDLYNPVWAKAEELGLPLHVHILTGRKGKGGFLPSTGERDAMPLVTYVTTVVGELQASLGHLIAGGAFDRYPGLKFVLAETDVGWIPHFRYRLDHFMGQAPGRQLGLQKTVAEYFDQNIYATAQFEKENLRFAAETIGSDHFMWSSDYPHLDCVFPNSRPFAVSLLEDFPDDMVQDILVRTACRLYGFDVAKLATPVLV